MGNTINSETLFVRSTLIGLSNTGTVNLTSDCDFDTNPDWEYRTFTLENDTLSGGFIRIGIEEAPLP